MVLTLYMSIYYVYIIYKREREGERERERAQTDQLPRVRQRPLQSKPHTEMVVFQQRLYRHPQIAVMAETACHTQPCPKSF